MSTKTYKTLHVRIMLGLTILGAIALFFVPPIPQPSEYHQFADSRSFIGIPNILNVATNILFLLAGAYGLKFLFDRRHGAQRARFESELEAAAYAAFFGAAVFTCFGSSYYHITPTNFSLLWDRMPMAVMFTSFLAIVISERVDRRAGLVLLPILITLGVASVWYWYRTELAGAGDLRPYLMVQFFPALLIAYMLFFLPSRYSRGSRFGWILVLYAVAKAAEFFDRQIFDELQQWVSGHTIKHILAAVAVFILAETIRCRIPINRNYSAQSELDQY